jgi:ribonuclease-3
MSDSPNGFSLPLTALEERVGHRFSDPALLELALTHRSAANEQGSTRQNERLEFLGDAVLGLLVAEALYRRYPARPEGELARAKAVLVSAGALAPYGESLGLGGALLLGVGEARSGGRRKASLLADTVEAVLGAVYLDGGIEAARGMVEAYLAWSDVGGEPVWIDAKTDLQERVQARGWPLPVYSIVDAAGPEHERRFTCIVELCGEAVGKGSGRSKKAAQQAAAAEALARLEPVRS